MVTGHEFRFSIEGRHTAAVEILEKVSMLLLHGADPSQRDSQGRVLGEVQMKKFGHQFGSG